jgi:hypothetical protein
LNSESLEENKDWTCMVSVYALNAAESTKPSITIRANQSNYSPGETLSLSWSITNPTSTAYTVDIFMGIIAPDGGLYFFDSSLANLVPGQANDPKTFPPAKTPQELSPGYDLNSTPFFSASLPAGLPEGTYQAFAALTETGSVQSGSPRLIGDMSLVSFTYTP